jgi:hypothetical protein
MEVEEVEGSALKRTTLAPAFKEQPEELAVEVADQATKKYTLTGPQ